MILYPYELTGGKTTLISEGIFRSSFPYAWQYLNSSKAILEARQKGKLKGPSWYGLSFSSSISMFSSEKIITPTLASTNAFSIDSEKLLFPQGAGGGCGIVVKPNISANYLLGLLNSKLLTFYFQRISSKFQGGWFAYEPRYLNRIPIHNIDLDDSVGRYRHERLVVLVEQMLQLHRQIATANTGHERTMLQRQIDATDRQIDQLVYELYGLTEGEISIVESAAS